MICSLHDFSLNFHDMAITLRLQRTIKLELMNDSDLFRLFIWDLFTTYFFERTLFKKCHVRLHNHRYYYVILNYLKDIETNEQRFCLVGAFFYWHVTVYYNHNSGFHSFWQMEDSTLLHVSMPTSDKIN